MVEHQGAYALRVGRCPGEVFRPYLVPMAPPINESILWAVGICQGLFYFSGEPRRDHAPPVLRAALARRTARPQAPYPNALQRLPDGRRRNAYGGAIPTPTAARLGSSRRLPPVREVNNNLLFCLRRARPRGGNELERATPTTRRAGSGRRPAFGR